MSDKDSADKPAEQPRLVADWFEGPGERPRLMRELLQREASVKSARFGIERREFLTGSMGALAALAVMQQAPRFASRAEAQDQMRGPSEDCYAQVSELAGAPAAARASFTDIAQGTAVDWQIIDAAARGQQVGVADTVLNMLHTLRNLYAGFSVDQYMHVTQTATRAKRANGTDEQIVIGLVHDMAKIISNYNHPEIVASIVRPYVSYSSYRILRHHMEFQWKNYGAQANLPTNLRDRYTAEPWYADAVRFSDEWDQTSFDAKYETMPLEEFEPLVRSFFGKVPAPGNLTASDCL